MAADRAADALDWLRRNLVVLATCELARATVAASEWAAVAAGDAILFPAATVHDGPSPPLRAIVLRFAGFAAPATIDEHGDVRLVGAVIPDPSHLPRSGELTVPETPSSHRSPASSPAAAANAADLLASASIELVAEVGRTTLRGQDLAGLLEGAVLGLGVRSDDLVVTLTCGGRPVARGTLVDVDGELGVRITSRLG
jgi:type III secretion system YscQ/HrcQ family protein